MSAFSPCVLIPVHNHTATLPAVLEGARRHAPVIVVDDGSTDGARAAIDAMAGPDLFPIFIPANRGKGAALEAGLERARELGFTHAVTIDADGQHDPAQIAEFLAAARDRPEALLTGARDLRAAGAPRGRRFANAFSNFWFRVQTGLRLPDTQCGFRCYPLAPLAALRPRARRYGWELEILVHAAWIGVPILPLPVRVDYDRPDSRRSHFRPIVDFLRITALNTRLTTQALALPRRARSALVRRGEPETTFWSRLMRPPRRID